VIVRLNSKRDLKGKSKQNESNSLEKKIKKMKHIILIPFVSALLLVGETTQVLRNDKSPTSSMMQVIEKILIDPEFKALGAMKQLHVLITIYAMLENFYYPKVKS
jgi:hypothetical protein